MRLAIFTNNCALLPSPAVSNSFGQHSANLVEDKWISLGKRGECPGLRADMADLDYFRTSNFGARSAQNHGSAIAVAPRHLITSRRLHKFLEQLVGVIVWRGRYAQS